MVIEKIHEKIAIPPRYIDENMNEYILKNMKSREKTCINKGFIKRVIAVDVISAEEISMADSSIYFSIECQIDVVKPEVGGVYTANRILTQLNNRLLVDIEGMFQCLIVNGSASGNFYVFGECSCKLPIKVKKSPETAISLSVVLIAVEFQDKKFVTIGEHKNCNKQH